MIEKHSAENIGKYNYTWWTDQPITPGIHRIAFIPQSAFDGWEAYCSCGEWYAYVSMYDCPTKDEVARVLRAAHDVHKANSGDIEDTRPRERVFGTLLPCYAAGYEFDGAHGVFLTASKLDEILQKAVPGPKYSNPNLIACIFYMTVENLWTKTHLYDYDKSEWVAIDET